jgi:hypothetical protein
LFAKPRSSQQALVDVCGGAGIADVDAVIAVVGRTVIVVARVCALVGLFFCVDFRVGLALASASAFGVSAFSASKEAGARFRRTF